MRYYLSLFTIILILSGCTQQVQYYKSNVVKDGQYDSEFPTQPISDEIEKIMNTVKMVSALAFYENYTFSQESKLTKKDIADGSFKGKAIKLAYLNKPATGTATVIHYKDRKIALLTCAHVLNFPDTVYTYFEDIFGRDSEYISSITIKSRQSNNVIELPQVQDFEILAMDSEQDLAIIGKELTVKATFPIPVFNYKIGTAEDLRWGTHTYLIGCPRGKKMITSCIVSRPGENTFLIDAAMPRGISGGIVLALRDGVPNFELVGMAIAISAETKSYLSPVVDITRSEFDTHNPYKDEVFINIHDEIYYGVTHATSIEQIIQFIENNKELLQSKGYNTANFFTD